MDLTGRWPVLPPDRVAYASTRPTTQTFFDRIVGEQVARLNQELMDEIFYGQSPPCPPADDINIWEMIQQYGRNSAAGRPFPIMPGTAEYGLRQAIRTGEPFYITPAEHNAIRWGSNELLTNPRSWLSVDPSRHPGQLLAPFDGVALRVDEVGELIYRQRRYDLRPAT